MQTFRENNKFFYGTNNFVLGGNYMMNEESTKSMFDDEIRCELEGLHTIELGTDMYSDTVTGVTKLTQAMIDLKKQENEAEKIKLERDRMREESRKNDIEEAKVEMEKKDKRIKNGIAIGTTVATFGATIWATKFSWIKEDNIKEDCSN